MATLTILALCLFGVMLAARLDRAEREVDHWRAASLHWQSRCAIAERDKHTLYFASLTFVGARDELWERVQTPGRN